MSKAKRAYYSDTIEKDSGDHRKLWKSFNHILHRCPAPKLPDCLSFADLAEKFGTFFIDKISLIRSSYIPCATPLLDDDSIPADRPTLLSHQHLRMKYAG